MQQWAVLAQHTVLLKKGVCVRNVYVCKKVVEALFMVVRTGVGHEDFGTHLETVWPPLHSNVMAQGSCGQ